jgi:hypothetical protein
VSCARHAESATNGSAQAQPGVKANVKAVQGELYFLEKGIIFIAKQPILIDFSKTESISFSRYADSQTYDGHG